MVEHVDGMHNNICYDSLVLQTLTYIR